MNRKLSFPVWRSLMFVPVNVLKYVDRAHTRGADVILLDLEDSVPLQEKAEARRLVPEAAEKVSRWGSQVAVRINRPWRLAVRDLEAVICPGVHALALPKVRNPEHILAIAEIVDELETEQKMELGATSFIPMIESPGALLQAEKIAAAHERVRALTIGAEDLSRSMDTKPDRDVLAYPAQRVAIAARAAGVLPLGFAGTVAQFRDLEAFRATIQHARRLGFLGALCIHPDQVPILNDEFRPTGEEVAYATKVITVYEEALHEGRGSIEVDGKMIDIPVVQRFQAIVDRDKAIKEREATIERLKQLPL